MELGKSCYFHTFFTLISKEVKISINTLIVYVLKKKRSIWNFLFFSFLFIFLPNFFFAFISSKLLIASLASIAKFCTFSLLSFFHALLRLLLSKSICFQLCFILFLVNSFFFLCCLSSNEPSLVLSRFQSILWGDSFMKKIILDTFLKKFWHFKVLPNELYDIKITD